MKIYLSINSISNSALLQDDLSQLVVWDESIGLSVNVSKCQIMNFSRKRSITSFAYFNLPPSSTDESVRDLGFILTRSLYPNKHIVEMCCESFMVLGFAQRICT